MSHAVSSSRSPGIKLILALVGVVAGGALTRLISYALLVGSLAFLALNTFIVLAIAAIAVLGIAATIWGALPRLSPLGIGLAIGTLGYTLFVVVVIVFVGFI